MDGSTYRKVGAFFGGLKMNCKYYVTFVYLDKRGNQRFKGVEYNSLGGIRTKRDVEDMAEMMKMYFNIKHLTILAFSPMAEESSDSSC